MNNSNLRIWISSKFKIWLPKLCGQFYKITIYLVLHWKQLVLFHGRQNLGFVMTHEWINDLKIIILGWTIPVRKIYVYWKLKEVSKIILLKCSKRHVSHTRALPGWHGVWLVHNAGFGVMLMWECKCSDARSAPSIVTLIQPLAYLTASLKSIVCGFCYGRSLPALLLGSTKTKC